MNFKGKITQYAVSSLLLIGLLGLYYLNNTYVINFFDNDFPLFIKRFKSKEIYLLDRQGQINVVGIVRLGSVIFFATMISLFHLLLVRTLLSFKTSVLFLLVVLSISVISGLFFILYKVFPSADHFYYLSRVLKDFLLSPLLLVTFIILFRFLNRP